MKEKQQNIIWSIVIILLCAVVFFSVKYFTGEFDNTKSIISNDTQNKIMLNSDNVIVNTWTHETVNTLDWDQEYKTINIADEEKQDTYSQEIKLFNNKDSGYFEHSMIKYPEILEYPEIMERYIFFKNETNWIEFKKIDMKKYESLWLDLHNYNLLNTIEKQSFGDASWYTYALAKNWSIDLNRDHTSKDCWIRETSFLWCFALVQNKNSIKFIYNLYWELSEHIFRGKTYIYNHTADWDMCAGYQIHTWFRIDGTKVKEITYSIIWCDSDLNIYTDWKTTVIFNNYETHWEHYKEKNFDELTIIHDWIIVESFVGYNNTYDYDIKENIFNIYKAIYSINDKKYRLSFWDLSIMKDKYDYKRIDGLYLHLGNTWNDLFHLKWTIKWSNKIEKVEIKNCKNNNDNEVDEWYKLNKFIPGSEEFQYNISKKYWNYCYGIYELKLTYLDINWYTKELIWEYRLDLK